jgi:hypothetical protein
MAGLLRGRRTMGANRDSDGHREYTVQHLIETSYTDGPAVAMTTPGLPLPGSAWSFGTDNDQWAWCRADARVTIHQEKVGDPTRFWAVEQVFSSKPPEKSRCQDASIQNPLLEPQDVSGSYTKYTEEATFDRFGRSITTSSHERFRGPQIEFDRNRPTVKIKQNVLNLGANVFSPMIDTVNALPLWGLPPRTIKLSNVSWQRKFYGQCFKYYERTLEFDINFQSFDRFLLDEGTKVLSGRWNRATGEWQTVNVNGLPPNPYNPAHFIRYKDRFTGENSRVVLNGRGLPADATTALANPVYSLSCPGADIGSFIDLPRTMNGRITEKTGTCTCLPDWFRMTYDDTTPIDNSINNFYGGPRWKGNIRFCGGTSPAAVSPRQEMEWSLYGLFDAVQGFVPPVTCNEFRLYGDCIGRNFEVAGGAYAPTVCSCDPFSLVFEVTIDPFLSRFPPPWGGPPAEVNNLRCCSGTAKVTITSGIAGTTGPAGYIPVQKYGQSNFLLLGIPTII